MARFLGSITADQITKELSEILSEQGLKLNADKTETSSDIIKSSLKPDKRYWIVNKRIAENKQKWLIQLYLFSENYPNSGTIEKQLKEFLSVLEKSKKKDSNLKTLISLVTEIGVRNPRVIPTAIAILSIFISRIKLKENRIQLAKKIKSKFAQVPNSSFIMVWFQRLYLKIDKSELYDEPLCKKITNQEEIIWNSTWLNNKLKKIVEETSIIQSSGVRKTRIKVSKTEIKEIVSSKFYY